LPPIFSHQSIDDLTLAPITITMAPRLPAVLLGACAVLLALATPLLAGDPDMLQDICVADYKSLEGRESPVLAFLHVHWRCITD
jgi:hypothetical protein